jgi:hypothetical protein
VSAARPGVAGGDAPVPAVAHRGPRRCCG